MKKLFLLFICTILFCPLSLFANENNLIAMNSYTKWDLLYNPKPKRIFYMKNKFSLSAGIPFVFKRDNSAVEMTLPYIGFAYTRRNHPYFFYGIEIAYINYKYRNSSNIQYVENVFPLDVFVGYNGRLHKFVDLRLSMGLGSAIYETNLLDDSSKTYDATFMMKPQISFQFKLLREFSFELASDFIISQSFKESVSFGDFDYFIIPKISFNYHF